MIEHRGINCLACTRCDLQQFRDIAKTGYGRCMVHEQATVFVRMAMGRNCDKYEEAPAEQVAKRQEWADRNPIPMWQR